MKIYLSGGSGWAGQEYLDLIHSMSPNFEIIDLGAPDVQIGIGKLMDLRYESAFEDFRGITEEDVLINFAGIIHPKKYVEFSMINAEGLGRMFKAFVKAGGKRILHVSSNSVLGFNDNNLPFSNVSFPRPYLGYGVSKLIAEHNLLRLSLDCGVSVIILRVPWFHGGKSPPMRQVDFYRMVLDGKFPLTGNGQNIRSVINVRNLAISIDAILESWHPGIYWVSDEENLTFAEYLDLIRSVGADLGLKVGSKAFIRLPGWLSSIARKMDSILQSIGLYNQKIHVIGELDQNIFGNSREFMSLFPDREYIPLKDAVRSSLEDLKKRGLLS